MPDLGGPRTRRTRATTDVEPCFATCPELMRFARRINFPTDCDNDRDDDDVSERLRYETHEELINRSGEIRVRWSRHWAFRKTRRIVNTRVYVTTCARGWPFRSRRDHPRWQSANLFSVSRKRTLAVTTATHKLLFTYVRPLRGTRSRGSFSKACSFPSKQDVAETLAI